MDDIRKSLRKDPALPARTFQVPANFKTDVRTALMAASRDKAAGPDAIPMRMTACAPDEATDFITALWTAVGRLGHLPAPLSDGIVVPVWKQKGIVEISRHTDLSLCCRPRGASYQQRLIGA